MNLLERKRQIDAAKGLCTDSQRKILAWMWLSICLWGYDDGVGHY